MKTEKIVKESSNIASWEYAAESQILLIKFHNGTSYAYYGVPASVHEGAKLAESIGKYFNATVKKGGFSYKKVATP